MFLLYPHNTQPLERSLLQWDNQVFCQRKVIPYVQLSTIGWIFHRAMTEHSRKDIQIFPLQAKAVVYRLVSVSLFLSVLLLQMVRAQRLSFHMALVCSLSSFFISYLQHLLYCTILEPTVCLLFRSPEFNFSISSLYFPFAQYFYLPQSHHLLPKYSLLLVEYMKVLVLLKRTTRQKSPSLEIYY